jgi:hypothetical protein
MAWAPLEGCLTRTAKAVTTLVDPITKDRVQPLIAIMDSTQKATKGSGLLTRVKHKGMLSP